MGLRVRVYGRGKVVAQDVKAGSFARKGSVVVLNFE